MKTTQPLAWLIAISLAATSACIGDVEDGNNNDDPIEEEPPPDEPAPTDVAIGGMVSDYFFLALGQALELFLTHLPDFLVAVVRHLLSGADVIDKRLVFLEQIDDRLDASVFLRQVPKLILVRDDIRISQQPRNFLEAIAYGFQLEAN